MKLIDILTQNETPPPRRIRRKVVLAVAAVGLTSVFQQPSAIESLQKSGEILVGIRSENAEPIKAVSNHTTNTPKIIETLAFDRELVLKDGSDRISQQFDIPENLKNRVEFWFDIYSKYDSEKKIIHHAVYPWIIFEVVDIGPIVHAEIPRRRWLRNEKADKFVELKMSQWKKALTNISRRGKAKTDLEKQAMEILKMVPGSMKKKASLAAQEIRIQTGQKDFFVEGLQLSHPMMPQIEEIFRSKKLPVELARLPFVESSFKDHATSKVGAKGIWQFTATTGKLFMRVDDRIDERRSPLKSSVGAAKLLKENHMILWRSWPLALSAWNHGPLGIKKASREVGSRDLGTIINRYRSKTFDFASANFYSEFLAALYVERYEKEIFGEIIKTSTPQMTSFVLLRKTRISDLLKACGLSQEEFIKWNPDVTETAKKNAYLPKGFELHVSEEIKSELARQSLVADARP